jgi:hypothetical protein
MNPHDEAKLERLVHQTLRDLPNRRAPHSLEARVRAEIARRAALPWWRQSFLHWPMAARIGFIIASAGIVKLVLFAAVWVMAGFDGERFRDAFSTQFAWMDSVLTVLRAGGEFFDIVARNIPPLWVYGGFAFVALMYVTFFGLGAAVYRALYVNR